MPSSDSRENPDDARDSFRGEKVLVTGAGGFIGSHLCQRLLEAGAEVRALVRYSSHGGAGNLEQLAPDIFARLEIVRSNIEDTESVQCFVKDCAVVFHLAALIGIPYSYHAPRSYLTTNISGTLNLLEAARAQDVRRFVLCSTSEVYGSAKHEAISEDHPLQAQSPYSASKIAAEKLTESYHCAFGLPTVTVRPFNTFGPRQSPRAIIPAIIMQALHEPQIRLGNLSPTRDLTYVSDTCDGLLRAGLTPEIEGLVCNLGTGESISMRDLAALILHRMENNKPITTETARVRPAASEVENLRSDNRVARERLGWQPLVRLETGLDETIAYYRKQARPARGAAYAV